MEYSPGIGPSISTSVEIFILAFFNGFWLFLIAKIISGIAVSLGSGTGSALLYDTLKVQKREKQHKRISGNLHTITNISMAFIFIIGAFLFSIDPKLPAIASLPLIILGFILTFFIEEPIESKKKLTLENSLNHLKEGLTYFKKSNFVKYIAFFSLFTASAISITLSISSAYLEQILIPISLIGLVAFISSMTTAYSSKKAHELEKKLGERKSLRLVQILIVLSLLLISLTAPYIGVLFYLMIPLVSGFFGIIVNDYVNKRIVSSHRATLLSITSFFDNLGIFILFITFGYLIKIKSISFSFFALGVIIFIGYVLLYFYSKTKKVGLSSK